MTLEDSDFHKCYYIYYVNLYMLDILDGARVAQWVR